MPGQKSYKQTELFDVGIPTNIEFTIAQLRSQRRSLLDDIADIEKKLKEIYADMYSLAINKEETLHFLITSAGKTMLAFRDGKTSVCVPVSLEELEKATYALRRMRGAENG